MTYMGLMGWLEVSVEDFMLALDTDMPRLLSGDSLLPTAMQGSS